LRAAGADVGAPVWLAPGHACDVPFTGPGAAIAQPGVDAVVHAASGRRKRLLVADMESTMIENEMLDDLAAMAGIGERIADITRRAMNGEIGFEAALRERVGLLAGLDARVLERAYDGVREIPGGRALVATMRKHGARCALVSGGFRFFTVRVRERLGFDLDQANDLILEGGKLSGLVAEPILGRQAKLDALLRLCAEQGIGAHEAITVGDGANDLAMLQAAGLGVAFHAKPAVAAQAKARIDHGDLTALLYLQGYRADEIVHR
jgi:phosphoserine phosphatase